MIGTGIIYLLFFLMIIFCYNDVVMGSEDLGVVIIGAGASGIAAATRLLKNNYTNFLVLEGSDRVGGRVSTVKFGGSFVDLGGEWVHGKTDNPVFDLAAPLGLLYTQNDYSGDIAFVRSSGIPINKELAEIGQDIYGTLTAPTVEMYNEINNLTSLGDFVLKLFWPKANILIANGKVTKEEADEFLSNLEKGVNTFDGSSSWFQTSWHGDYRFFEPAEDYSIVWKGGYGYSTILDLIKEALPNPSKKLPVDERILLKKEVVKVDYFGPKVIVTTADGTQYITKRVITTVSLAVLKETANSLFVPNLPPGKALAIKGLGISVVDKIYLEFPFNWLPSGINGINMVWRAQDIASVPEKYRWTTEVFGFYKTDRLPLTVLCGWIGGPAAEAMETATDEEVVEQSMILLKKFAPNQIEVPNSTAMLRSKWRSNRLIRGSYSFRHIDSDALNVGPADLAAPVNDTAGNPVLLFAGEATDSDHYGAVHGAIKAGWREADRILSLSKQ